MSSKGEEVGLKKKKNLFSVSPETMKSKNEKIVNDRN
jgi:hypothetical protein